MIKIYCDRCKKELNPNKRIGYIALNSRDSYEGDLMEDNQYEHMHFCMECMDRVKEFLKMVPEKDALEQEISVSEHQENESKQFEDGAKPGKNVVNKKESKRRPIDYGKIMALRNAGWSNEKIAEEMHMTKASVATAISTYKKKHSGGVIHELHSLWKKIKKS